MGYDGKRLGRERLPRQLNIDEQMKARITLICAETGLTRQQVIYKSLQWGLDHHPQFTIHEIDRIFTHASAQVRTSTHSGAPPRTSPRDPERKTGTGS
jgi:hypothetical protein